MNMKTNAVIVGTGVAGLFSALNLPRDRQIIMITKSDLESSDSFLAQGGICVLRDESDYDSYYEDTMRAGHYENRKESVDIMIRSSREIIDDLIGYGVDFAKENGELLYTGEGAHSKPRILFHEDITGKEITSKLLSQVKKMGNVTIYEYTTMTDIIEKDGACDGIIAKNKNGEEIQIYAEHTLKEDISSEDVTTNSVMKDAVEGEVELICKQDGVIAGLDVFKRVFELLDSGIRTEFYCKDGDEVQSGQLMGIVRGDIRVLLSGERVALNYLQRMSGIATYTHSVAEMLKGSGTKLLNTRKTTPNMRRSYVKLKLKWKIWRWSKRLWRRAQTLSCWIICRQRICRRRLRILMAGQRRNAREM